MRILEIKDLTKNFYLHNVNREIKSCSNVNFSLDKGQFIGIVGLSGGRQVHNPFLTGGSDFHGRYEPNSPDIGAYISEQSGMIITLNLQKLLIVKLMYYQKPYVLEDARKP